MKLFNGSALFAVASLALAACGSNGATPAMPSSIANGAPGSTMIQDAVDTTSILKKLKKDVVIGSSVDSQNGDQGPRGISVVPSSYQKLTKGHIVVCNFDNKAGDAGSGTTVEQFDDKAGSKPVRFWQGSKGEGCGDASVSPANDSVYVSGYTSHLALQIVASAKLKKTYGKPLKTPISDVDAACVGGFSKCGYASEYVYFADATTGGIVSFSVNGSGNPKPTEVISGFDVNNKSGWSALGPAGLSFYYPKSGTLYAVDGVDNTVVSFNSVTLLLATSEIVVEKGGKKFKCKYKKLCGTLIYAGSPVDAPVAMTRLPNGNLIVANSGGSSPNTLVELTTTGKVLDTKVIDTSTTPGIFGLYAIGTTDSNTALYYTDTNDNDLHELEQ